MYQGSGETQQLISRWVVWNNPDVMESRFQGAWLAIHGAFRFNNPVPFRSCVLQCSEPCRCHSRRGVVWATRALVFYIAFTHAHPIFPGRRNAGKKKHPLAIVVFENCINCVVHDTPYQLLAKTIRKNRYRRLY